MRTRHRATLSLALAATLALAAAAAAQPAPSGAAKAGKPPAAKSAEPKASPAKTPTPAGGAGGAAPASIPSSAPRADHKDAPAGKAAPAPKPAAKGGGKTASAKRPEPPRRGRKPLPRKAGEAGEPDEATRRIIAGTSAAKGSRTTESAELRAMRELDLSLFPSARPGPDLVWPSDTVDVDADRARVSSSGLPPRLSLGSPAPAEAPVDTAWLRSLALPDIPVRWDARVVRYLEFYKNDPRGRSMVAGWIKKSGRYGAQIRRVLRDNGLPEDILWLSLVESGFDPTISSPAGAAGLWQFMPDGARIYGLTVDRWVDERLDPERSTVAAARYLADLRQRFGGWELAFAAYNMGYGGLLASIRKYNSNDYWELSRLEAAIPFETALYVPKIVAMAIVARNCAVFGCQDVELDPAVSFDRVSVGTGVSLKSIASAAGVPTGDIERLNPQLLSQRTPPVGPGETGPASLGSKRDASWVVRVPVGMGPRAAKTIRETSSDRALLRHQIRWGETLDDVATARQTTKGELQSLNGLRKDEVLRPGTVLLVPAPDGTGAAARAELGTEPVRTPPVVVVPAQAFSYPGRRRVFYRVVAGDTVRDLASGLGVIADELCRWNQLDATASLHEGMSLQLFVPQGDKRSDALLLEEKDARVLVAGSPEFFAHFEGQKGRERLEIAAKEGDTWRSLARRYGLSVGMLERINQKSRSSPLSPGDRVVVYVPSSKTRGRPDAPAAPEPGDRPAAEAVDDVAIAAAPDEQAPGAASKPSEAEATAPAATTVAPAAPVSAAKSPPGGPGSKGAGRRD